MLQQTFRDGGIGHPYGMQLCGKTLGIIGMGAIGEQLSEHAVLVLGQSCNAFSSSVRLVTTCITRLLLSATVCQSSTSLPCWLVG